MQIEVFSLCDAATIEGGKLNLLGAFDTIMSEVIPVTHPQCTVALRFRFNNLEGEEHQVEVKFVDADGNHIVQPTNGLLKMNYSDEQRSSSANLVLNLHGLKLEKFGEYSIDLTVDGKPKASLPFFVRKKTVKA